MSEHQPHPGDALWNKAVHELGDTALPLIWAYQAGVADAARDILAAESHEADTIAHTLIEQSQTLLDEPGEPQQPRTDLDRAMDVIEQFAPEPKAVED